MEEQYIIEVNNVSVIFKMSKERIENIKEYFLKLFHGGIQYDKFTAVDNVSIKIKPGEVFGIIGLNGSGKSTLLKIISGIFKPTLGNVVIHGTIAPLIELGAGFDMDLTAKENIYLNGSVLGYSRKFMDEKFQGIVDFSELADFVDVPLKNYSSGMVARIGFAIATVTQPDILIVDEILSVGDFLFQQKCEARIKELMDKGTTIIIVSHSVEQIERLCDRVAWLDHGHLMDIGKTLDVTTKYRAITS
ncbi:MAG: ABC transporter ATP-binding protein [Clostridia bacterium]